VAGEKGKRGIQDSSRTMRTGCLLGGIKVELRDAFIVVFTPVFRRKKMAETLVDMGCDVDGL
jgi:hypothetical protein